jgi:hypothetical protein
MFQDRSFIWENEVVDRRRKRKSILGIFFGAIV